MNEYEQDMERRWQHLQEPLRRADTTHIPAGVLQLARVVAGIPDPEMTCEECQAWLPSYVDDEIGALPVETLYPKVKRHLELCDECALEYLELRHWALVVDEERLPQNVEIPIPDLSFLPPLSLTEYVRSVAKKLVQALAAEQIEEYPSIADMLLDAISTLEKGFIFQPDAALGDFNAFDILKVSYNTTQLLLQEWTASDIDQKVKQSTLSESVRQQAEEEARQHFSPKEAQRFAERYAEIACQDPASLQSLLTHQ